MAPHTRTTVSAGKNREDHHEQDEHHQHTPATSIELVDPASLLVDLNVRHYARLDARSVRASRSSACWCPSSPSVPPRSSFGSGSVTVAPSPPSRPVEASVPVVVAADEATTDSASVERLERVC